jgi:hypothetical protein
MEAIRWPGVEIYTPLAFVPSEHEKAEECPRFKVVARTSYKNPPDKELDIAMLNLKGRNYLLSIPGDVIMDVGDMVQFARISKELQRIEVTFHVQPGSSRIHSIEQESGTIFARSSVAYEYSSKERSSKLIECDGKQI